MQTGLDQYAIKKFAEALEVIPRILSETSGQDAEKVGCASMFLHRLYDRHLMIGQSGNCAPADVSRAFEKRWPHVHYSPSSGSDNCTLTHGRPVWRRSVEPTE